MKFVWKLPNDPPHEAALNRMKQHFPKPTEPMPEAWFNTKEIRFYTNLVETPTDQLDSSQLGEAIKEIAGGIVAFPEVEYVRVWKDWFKYLLPYALPHIHQIADQETVFISLLTAFISIYPNGIHKEYDGFRDDVVYNLGAGITPKGSPIQLEDNSIFNDIWYLTDSETGNDQPDVSEEFSLPMLFCLKYLYPSEIRTWVQSLVKINTTQWRLAVVMWWLAFKKFLALAENWPTDGNIKQLLEIESGFITTFWVCNIPFKSLNDFIPLENRLMFEQEFAKHLTRNIYQRWNADILAYEYFQMGSNRFPTGGWTYTSIEKILQEFESSFFNRP